VIPVLVSIPILGVLLILQTAVVSQVPLLHGACDLILLAIVAWTMQKRVQTGWHWALVGGVMVTLVSAVPFGAAMAGYLIAVLITLLLRQRVWQAPILAMFIAVFLGTLVSQSITFFALMILGDPLPVIPVLSQTVLPSLLLNILFSVPAYAIFGDLAGLLYPEELEV
jgi:rod shape-determining protein MreD